MPGAGAVLVPIGGGGALIAGVAAGLRRSVERQPGSWASKRRERRRCSLLSEAGGPVELPSVDTMADGIAVRRVLRSSPMSTQRRLVDEVVTVDEEQIQPRPWCCSLERCKWVVEPAGAVPLAALLAGAVPGDDAVVLLISGGNVDPLLLTRLVEHGLTRRRALLPWSGSSCLTSRGRWPP